MNTSKIEVNIGNFSFNGEGESDWLAAQLDKLLDRAEKIVSLFPTSAAAPAPSGDKLQQKTPADLSGNADVASKSLAAFLKEKGATTNQVSKFLVTAAWLEAKGQKRLNTADVSSALKNGSQSRLGNPSDCLNRNVAKGLIEKDGSQFFVTQEGKAVLGIA